MREGNPASVLDETSQDFDPILDEIECMRRWSSHFGMTQSNISAFNYGSQVLESVLLKVEAVQQMNWLSSVFAEGDNHLEQDKLSSSLDVLQNKLSHLVSSSSTYRERLEHLLQEMNQELDQKACGKAVASASDIVQDLPWADQSFREEKTAAKEVHQRGNVSKKLHGVKISLDLASTAYKVAAGYEQEVKKLFQKPNPDQDQAVVVPVQEQSQHHVSVQGYYALAPVKANRSSWQQERTNAQTSTEGSPQAKPTSATNLVVDMWVLPGSNPIASISASSASGLDTSQTSAGINPYIKPESIKPLPSITEKPLTSTNAKQLEANGGSVSTTHMTSAAVDARTSIPTAGVGRIQTSSRFSSDLLGSKVVAENNLALSTTKYSQSTSKTVQQANSEERTTEPKQISEKDSSTQTPTSLPVDADDRQTTSTKPTEVLDSNIVLDNNAALSTSQYSKSTEAEPSWRVETVAPALSETVVKQSSSTNPEELFDSNTDGGNDVALSTSKNPRTSTSPGDHDQLIIPLHSSTHPAHSPDYGLADLFDEASQDNSADKSSSTSSEYIRLAPSPPAAALSPTADMEVSTTLSSLDSAPLTYPNTEPMDEDASLTLALTTSKTVQQANSEEKTTEPKQISEKDSSTQTPTSLPVEVDDRQTTSTKPTEVLASNIVLDNDAALSTSQYPKSTEAEPSWRVETVAPALSETVVKQSSSTNPEELFDSNADGGNDLALSTSENPRTSVSPGDHDQQLIVPLHGSTHPENWPDHGTTSRELKRKPVKIAPSPPAAALSPTPDMELSTSVSPVFSVFSPDLTAQSERQNDTSTTMLFEFQNVSIAFHVAVKPILVDEEEKMLLEVGWLAAFFGVILVAVAAYAIRSRLSSGSKMGSSTTAAQIDSDSCAARLCSLFECSSCSAKMLNILALLVDTLILLIGLANFFFHAVATEVLILETTKTSRASLWLEFGRGVALIHDIFEIISICIIGLLLLARAWAATAHPRWHSYGLLAPLQYLTCDPYSYFDIVAITISLVDFRVSRVVHVNFAWLSLARAVEILGKRGIGIRLTGVLGTMKNEQAMFGALSALGLVLWILISGLYHVLNFDNQYARSDYVQIPSGEKWQRFESVPSSMFYALLNLCKKNPLANVYPSDHERVLVTFVSVLCVPFFALATARIGSTIATVLTSNDGTSAIDDSDQGQLAVGVEEMQLQDAGDLSSSARETDLSDFYPYAVTFLSIGSVVVYFISTAGQTSICYVTIKINYVTLAIVDGTAGIIFLLDWLIQFCRYPRSQPLYMELVDLASSIPGVVHLVLFASGMLGKDYFGFDAAPYKFLCAACVFRILKLDKFIGTFEDIAETLWENRKVLTTTGVIAGYTWMVGSMCMYLSEYANPDPRIGSNYDSLARALWTTGISLQGDWVFCDFTWAGKTTSAFIALFGVSICMLPLLIFIGGFYAKLQGDFVEVQSRILQMRAQDETSWQLYCRPPGDSPQWRQALFSTFYAHLEKLQDDSVMRAAKPDSSEEAETALTLDSSKLPASFRICRALSIWAACIMSVATVIETSEFHRRHYSSNVVYYLFYCCDCVCVTLFFLEFISRCLCLGWRHPCSCVGLCDIASTAALVATLTTAREQLLHPAYTTNALLNGSIMPLRLLRLFCVESYICVMTALKRSVLASAAPLLRSWFTLMSLWCVHATLLHVFEGSDPTLSIGGAQILPSVEGLKLHNVNMSASIPQSARYGDVLTAMQYSLVHLSGDFPLVDYSLPAKLILLFGVVAGTCMMATFTGLLSSSIANYIVCGREDEIAEYAEHRVLLIVQVAVKIQRAYRRRKQLREAGGAGAVPSRPQATAIERIRRSIRQIVFWKTQVGKIVMTFFGIVLISNCAFNVVDTIPELERLDSFQMVVKYEEVVASAIFFVELVLRLVAGGVGQGRFWKIARMVDALCLLPGFTELYINFIVQDRTAWTAAHPTFERCSDGLQLIRVVRVLDLPIFRKQVQTVCKAVEWAAEYFGVPAFLSWHIWVFTSSVMMWMENAYDGPAKDMMKSLPSTMYWTSSFLIGEWTLIDFSPGAGSRVGILISLVGIMMFAIPLGLLSQAVEHQLELELIENAPVQDLPKKRDDAKAAALKLSKDQVQKKSE